MQIVEGNGLDRQQSLVDVYKYIGNIPSENQNNPTETLKDVIDAELQECYNENQDGDIKPSKATTPL